MSIDYAKSKCQECYQASVPETRAQCRVETLGALEKALTGCSEVLQDKPIRPEQTFYQVAEVGIKLCTSCDFSAAKVARIIDVAYARSEFPQGKAPIPR